VAWRRRAVNDSEHHRLLSFGTTPHATGVSRDWHIDTAASMTRSWRDRPAGTRFARLWRPWEQLNPFRGRGRRIHERPGVGLRDLVAAPDEVVHRPTRRWKVIGVFFLLLLGLVVYRLYDLQIVHYSSSLAAVRANSLRTSTIPATRGLILDRSGTPLVTNQTTVTIRLSRAEADLHPAIKGALAALMGSSVRHIDAALANPQYDPYQPVPVLTNAPASVVEYLKLHQQQFPGVSVEVTSLRHYPYGGDFASQLIGYVGPITGQEITQHPNDGYKTTSQIGKSGVEAFYEHFLKGKDGTSTLEVNAFNQILGTIHASRPHVGDNVILNVDQGLQNALDHYLAQNILSTRNSVDPRSGKRPPANSGAAIVMDPTNGQVLAMSSYPSFNLQSFLTGLTNTQYHELIAQGSFNNFAIQGLYTPGSTFKLISATAQLQTGVLSPWKTLNDTGAYKVPGCLQGAHGCVFHDDEVGGVGRINLPLALARSSDYYFYNLGYLFWSQQRRYGLTPIQNVAAKYGLGQSTNIDLPGEVTGRVDSPTVRQQLHDLYPQAFPNVSWYTGDNIEMAFGQGSTAVTPIEMAAAYATFANGGTFYAPEVAAAVLNPHNHIVVRYEPRVVGHVSLPPAIRNPILQGLIGVVNDPTGTAYYTFQQFGRFNHQTFQVAGKTGTASNAPGQEPNSWFVGFAPATHPKYLVLCVIGEGGYGASAAGPVVAQTFTYLASHHIGPVRLKPNIHVPGA
jgi:penicillin-binding protein 2